MSTDYGTHQPAPQPIVVNVAAPAAPTHKRTRHGLHIFLCVITGGLWIPVYLARWLINRNA